MKIEHFINALSEYNIDYTSIKKDEYGLAIETKSNTYAMVSNLLRTFGIKGSGLAGGGHEMYKMEGNNILAISYNQDNSTRIYFGYGSLAF